MNLKVGILSGVAEISTFETWPERRVRLGARERMWPSILNTDLKRSHGCKNVWYATGTLKQPMTVSHIEVFSILAWELERVK